MVDVTIWERLGRTLRDRDIRVFRMYQSDFGYAGTISILLSAMMGGGKPSSIDECVWHQIIDDQMEFVAAYQESILERDEDDEWLD